MSLELSEAMPQEAICGTLCSGNMKIFWRILGNSLNIPILQVAGVLSVTIIYFSVYYHFDTTLILHMCLTTIGLALLTSEAIMIMANKQFCGPLTQNQNAIIHAVLVSLGLFITIAGSIIISNSKMMKNESHYDTIHGITGLVSVLFLIISFILGICSLISKYLINGDILNMSTDSLRWFYLPHHIFGSLGYAIGMGSLCYGTSSTEFRSKVQYELRIICVVLTIVVAAWTMVCIFVEVCRVLKGLVKMYEDNTHYANNPKADDIIAEPSGRKMNRVFQENDTDGSSN